jgi:hypothetical protein
MFPCTSGSGTAAAEAGAGRLRALGRSDHFCCGTASGGNGSARFQIDNVVITGPPADSIPISLNFRLRGTVTSNVDSGVAGVSLFLALQGPFTNLVSDSHIVMNSVGIVLQSGVFAPLAVGFPNAAIDQSFVTDTVNVRPNLPVTLQMQLAAFTGMAGDGFTQTDFYSGGNGLSLPFGIPVFNLPPGYTIDIPELNVINNFATGGGDTTPPTIGDNADLVLAATSAAGAGATFAAPDAADDSGVVDVGCAPASGSVFPIGHTTVVCTATDGSGNTAQSEFSVTVLCCSIGVTVDPATARRGETVWITAQVQNHSALVQAVTLQIELSGPQRTVVGTIPLRLPPGIDRSIRLPFRVPRIAPVGEYTVVLTTVTAEGRLQTSATLTVLP